MADKDDDEQAGWAEMCAAFDEIRYGAALGLQQEWKECVEETVAGRGSLDRWHALVAAVEEANGLSSDFTGRHGGSGEVASAMREFYGRTETVFTCPVDLCSRREPKRTVGTPSCDLFDVGMRETHDA